MNGREPYWKGREMPLLHTIGTVSSCQDCICAVQRSLGIFCQVLAHG